MSPLRFAPLAALVAFLFAAPAPAAVPAPDPAVPPLRLPQPVERRLENGLRVVVFPISRQPIVQVELFAPAGSAYEPENKAGVAFVTARLLTEGTPSRTRTDVADELARAGATITTHCDVDVAQVVEGGRAESLESMLEVMSDVVINPLFGADRFTAFRLQIAREQGAALGTLANAASTRVRQRAFAPHPYAHAAAPEPQSVLGVDLAAVQAFHRDRWRPDRAVLVVAGDVAPERVFAAAQDWFGKWAGHTAPDPARPAFAPPAGIGLIDVPGADHAEVRVAVPGPGLASPEHAGWALLQSALANETLPPGVSVSFENDRDASLLVLALASAPRGAGDAIKTLIGVLRDAVAKPPAGAELEALRRSTRQGYPLSLGSLGGFVAQWQQLDFAGLPAGSVATLGDQRAAAALEPALRTLGGKPVVLVAGSAATLREPLAALGMGAVDAQPLVAQLPQGAPTATVLPPGTAEQKRRGRAVIASAVLAHGGAAALAAVKTSVHEGAIVFTIGGQELEGLFSAVRVAPDRYSYSTRMLQLESRQMVSGSVGWNWTKAESTTVAPLDSLAMFKLRLASDSDLIPELRMASSPAGDPVWRGSTTLAGRRCDLVDFATPYGRQRFAVDQLTHRVVEMAAGPGPNGEWSDRRTLGDFRRVNGLLLPFTEDRKVRGEKVWRITARDIAINRPIPEQLWVKPRTIE